MTTYYIGLGRFYNRVVSRRPQRINQS